jgi:hypothetical protein
MAKFIVTPARGHQWLGPGGLRVTGTDEHLATMTKGARLPADREEAARDADTVRGRPSDPADRHVAGNSPRG